MTNIFKVIILTLLCFYLCAANSTVELPAPNKEPNQPAYLKTIPPDKLKEDLDFLFKTIEEVHPNMYAYTSKEEFAKYRNELYKQIDRPMNQIEFYKLAAPAVASLKSGHTYIQPFTEELKKFIESGGRVFPLALHWDGSKVIAVKNFTSTTLPIGGTVLTINGQPAAEVFARLAHRFPAENKNTNPDVVERPEIFGWLLRLEYGVIDSWTVEVKGPDEVVNSYIIKSVPWSVITAVPTSPDAEEKKNHYKFIPKYNTSILEINSFGTDLEKFKRFLRESFQKIRKQKVLNLIIDIRENPGGSDLNAGALIEHLTAKPYRQFKEARIKLSSQDEKSIAPLRQQQPKLFRNKKVGDIITFELPIRKPPYNPLRFTGQIFVLIGPRSFSTSTSFAATIKQFGIGKLVGEETGDPTVVYGNVINVPLTNSGLVVAVAGRAFIFAGGKPDGRGVLPDYEVKQNPQDLAKGIDTALEFTLNLIKSGDSALNNGKAKK